jgi:hypothetical protein
MQVSLLEEMEDQIGNSICERLKPNFSSKQDGKTVIALVQTVVPPLQTPRTQRS